MYFYPISAFNLRAWAPWKALEHQTGSTFLEVIGGVPIDISMTWCVPLGSASTMFFPFEER